MYYHFTSGVFIISIYYNGLYNYISHPQGRPLIQRCLDINNIPVYYKNMHKRKITLDDLNSKREAIKERLALSAAESGLNFAEIIRRTGLPESSVKNLIYGKVANPNYDLVKKLASILEVNPDYLMLETDDPTPIVREEDYTLDKPFDYGLYVDAVTTIKEIADDKSVELPQDKVETLSKKVYYYHRKDDETVIDRKFVEFAIDTLITNSSN